MISVGMQGMSVYRYGLGNLGWIWAKLGMGMGMNGYGYELICN